MTEKQQYELNSEILAIQDMIKYWKENPDLDKNNQVLTALEYAKYSINRRLEE